MTRILIALIVAFLSGCSAAPLPPPDSSPSGRQPIIDPAVVDALHHARRQDALIAPFAEARALELADAYAVQDALTGALVADGDPLVGYKVGFNSAAAQDRWSLDEPAWASLLSTMRVEPGATLSRDPERTMLVEVEVAFTLAGRIDSPVASTDALLALVSTVHPAFELPEIRFERAPSGLDLIADGVGAKRFILGPGEPSSALEALLPVTLRRDDDILLDGVSGEPLEALLWFVNDRVARGGALEPGQVLLAGALGAPIPLRGEVGDGIYRADFGSLGTLEFTLGSGPTAEAAP